MELDINKPAAKICQEDDIDGFVFLCPRCSLYGPSLDDHNRCFNCGQLIDVKAEKFIKKKRRIRYLTDKQMKDYWDKMIKNFKKEKKFKRGK